jgi:hypothetical protein
MPATARDWSDVEACAAALAGNHRHFRCFAWWRLLDQPERWTLVYTHHRDSGLTDQSNAAVIEQRLRPFVAAGDVIPEHHTHWAVGWIDGYALRVYRADGSITEAFRTWCALQDRLTDSSLLDASDHAERQYQAAVDAIRLEGRGLVRSEAPSDWPERVHAWLSDHADHELEDRDGTGPYPSATAVRTALAALSLPAG